MNVKMCKGYQVYLGTYNIVQMTNTTADYKNDRL